ncbi:MAG: hypothetical protein PHW76_01590 [Alphaproteobacteria bacterium]|nr:hypothetical protein [Alphaproteobacteria bacterium]
MSECPLKSRAALLASVAANIFLVAFVLGNATGHKPPPAMEPPTGRGHSPHLMAPHMMGPGDLFAPDQLRADEARMRENFAKIEGLRKSFADKLKAGPVTKEEALKHFADIDAIMETVKTEARDRAAARISSMSDEERKELAEKLSRMRPPPSEGKLPHEPRSLSFPPGAPDDR